MLSSLTASDIQTSLKETYQRLLAQYMQSQDETALNQFAELGRLCVLSKVSQEEIAEVHTEAMLAVLVGSEPKELLQRSGECLVEVLMSYGLSFLEQSSRRELDNQLRLFSQVVENTQDGVIITDLTGKIVQVNPAFCTVTGYSKDEAIGSNPSMLQSGQQNKSFYTQMWDEIRKSGSWQGKIRNRRKNGSVYPEQLSITTVMDHDDQPAYYVGIFSDISEQVNLEKQLQQSQKMEAVGTLVGGIAHDFNNMLAGIMGSLYLINKKNSDPDIVSRLGTIDELCTRAADMISQLLAFSRRGIVQKQSMNLATFAKQAIKLVKVGIPENIHIDLSMSDMEMVIEGDHTQLQQVMMNLLNNARDAVEGLDHPLISVHLDAFKPDQAFLKKHETAVADTTYARVTISDNGCGISKANLKKVFDPFFTTKEVGKGTGLGLSMVYGMMKSHHGIVQVDSVIGRGTDISLYFVRQDSSSAEKEEKVNKFDDEKGSGTILLADDEHDLRKSVAEVLESFGYRVLQAADGLEAYDIFSKHHESIDLLMLDVVMPHQGGPKLAKKLRVISPYIPVLYATGYDRAHVLDEAGFEDERSHVLTKPFNFSELNKVIVRLMAS